MLKAIETRYKGYRFRSRLEARWAVFFDALGVEWEYEKEGYDLGETGWYLPDFWLPTVYDRSGLRGVWVEIKGQEPTEKERIRCEQLAVVTKQSSNLFVGLPDPEVCNNYQWTYEKVTAEQFLGWRNAGFSENDIRPIGSENIWEDFGMVFHRCGRCQAVKIEFSNDYYTCFQCKHRTCTQSDISLYEAFDRAKSARFEHGERS